MTGLEEARTLLPWWVVWGPLVLCVPLAFLLSFAIASLAAFMAGWSNLGSHELSWPERARLAYPVRLNAGRLSLLIGLSMGVSAFRFSGSLCPLPFGVLAVVIGLAGYAGAALVAFLVERSVRRGQFTLVQWLRGLVLYCVLFRGWLAPLVFIPLMPETFGTLSAGLLAAGVGGLLFFSVGGGLLIARFLGLLMPAPQRLRDVVENVASAMGVAVKGIHLLPFHSANAYAFLYVNRIGFTPAALEIFNDEELSAVCAHELGHLSESWLMKLSRLAPLFALLPLVAAVPFIHSFGLWPLAVLVLGILLAAVLMRRLSRRLERRADRLALEQQGAGGIYAQALEKLYAANLVPVVELGKGSSHPHLYDRLIAGAAPPAYPRPRPPSRLRSTLPFAIVVACLFAMVVAQGYARPRENETLIFVSLAVRNGDAFELASLARRRWDQTQLGEAATFYRASAETSPRSADLKANEAIVLVWLGRCDEARQAAREARHRLDSGGYGAPQAIDDAWDAAFSCWQPPPR